MEVGADGFRWVVWVLFGFFLVGLGLGFWGVREGFVEFFCSFGGGSEV